MSKLRPIKTAPRNGEPVLLYCGPAHDPIWGVGSWGDADSPSTLPAGWYMWHAPTVRTEHWPTHWQPLPEPPPT